MPRILVVDAEPDMRFLIRLYLEKAGHQVVEAGHGAAALESVHEALPDLVVTDVMMPVMGGLELIERLRSDPATATIPILVVSGDSELAEGADTALEKPFAPDRLVEAASALLSSRSAVS